MGSSFKKGVSRKPIPEYRTLSPSVRIRAKVIGFAVFTFGGCEFLSVSKAGLEMTSNR
jgi:hypothetical protein